jgi:dihydrofolate reductase
MRRIIVSEFITLDGVIEDPGGQHAGIGGWAFQFDRGPEGDKFKLDELLAADALLLGRVTYEGFAAAWPNMTEGPFGEKMNGMPKYVVSSTLERADWNNSTIIGGDVVAQVSELKHGPGGDVLVAGSAQLVRTLTDHDLVDEYRLMVYPVVLGQGKRLFGDPGSRVNLRLTRTLPAGECLVLTYEPAGVAAPLESPVA